MRNFSNLRSECSSCPFDAYHYTLEGYHACTRLSPPTPILDDIEGLLKQKEKAGCKTLKRGVLYADTREKGGVLNYVQSRCDKKDIEFELSQLPTGFGDYYFEFVDEDEKLLSAGFERKTFEDFYRSIISGSLTIQVQSLVDNVDFPFLLLSGSLDVVDYTHYDLVLGTIGACAAEHGLSIISNMTDAQLATVLVATVENLHLNKHRVGMRARRKEIDLRIQFLINAFGGVGIKTAEAMIEHFGSIDKMVQVLRENPELFSAKIRGISPGKANEFQRIVTSEESVERISGKDEKKRRKGSSRSAARRKRQFARKSAK